MLPLFIMAIENDTDRQFVAGLYQRHRDFLLRCAQKILNDPDRAEEALHEAMLRVIRSLERVRQIPAEELLPYLVTIVQTASIDLYHKTNRERQAAQGRERDWAESLSGTEDTELLLIRREQAELLRECLKTLPQREIDLLNYAYTLDEKALEEQYADLLLKIALKEYLKEQALQMKQQEAEAAPAPQPAQKSSNVVAVAFRQVGWQETKETLLHGLKKGVTRVAVVFLAAALTATTVFALSPVERKESILEKVINTIRNYADMLTNTSTMVEVPRYRYEEYSFIEVPNEQVQEVIDTWVIFRNSVNFTEKSGISLSAVMKAMYYYCEAKGLEYPYTDDTHTWVDAKAVQQFAEYLFSATKEHLDWEVYLEPRYYDAERDAYRDIHYEDGYPNYITIARSGLVSYTENEDGTFTIELVMEPDSDWNEYCYSPVIITADYSSGHLVLVSGTVKDMLSEAELSLTQQRLEYERINPTGRR